LARCLQTIHPITIKAKKVLPPPPGSSEDMPIIAHTGKLKPKAIENYIEDYKSILLETWEEMPNYFITSSTKGNGKDDLLNYIESINLELNQTS